MNKRVRPFRSRGPRQAYDPAMSATVIALRPKAKRIKDPVAYAAAIERQTPADRRMRTLNYRSTGMRKKPTTHEQVAYYALKLLNLPFHRQVVIGRYIVDFLLTNRNVILEIDGPSHTKTVRYDKERDTFLRRMGWTVLRVKNEVVSFDALKALLAPFPIVTVEDVKGRLEYSREIEQNRIAKAEYQASRATTRAGCIHADSNRQAGSASTPQVTERGGSLENAPRCPVAQATPMLMTMDKTVEQT